MTDLDWPNSAAKDTADGAVDESFESPLDGSQAHSCEITRTATAWGCGTIGRALR